MSQLQDLPPEKPQALTDASPSEPTQENASPPSNLEGEAIPQESQDNVDPDTESPEAEKDDPRFSERMAKLMRRERELIAKQRQFKEQLRQDPDFVEFQKFKKAKEAETPDEALGMLGWEYDKLIRHKLGEKENEPSKEEMLEKKLAALEEKLSKREEQEQQSEQERIEKAALQSIQKELEANESDYELTLLNNASSLVYDVIKEHYSSTGEVLPTKKAAGLVEDHLEGELAKFEKSKKLRKRFIPGDEPKDIESDEPQAPAPSQAKETPSTITSKAIQGGSLDEEEEAELWDEEASRRRIAEKWKAGLYHQK